MVFQSYALFPHMTVLENVCYGLRASGMRKAQAVELAQAKLALVGLAGYGARLPSELSGGQQQRVAVARAIVLEPKVLLFDEPLSNLDAKLRRHVREEIRELQQSLSLTAVYVTHDQQEALAISDRIMVMSMARIAQDGTPRGLYEQPNSHFVADFIGDANIVPVTIESRQGDMASVRLGPLLLTLPHHGAVEGAAELSIRPQALLLAPGGDGLCGQRHEGGLSRQPHGILGIRRGTRQGAVRRLPGGAQAAGRWRSRRCDRRPLRGRTGRRTADPAALGCRDAGCRRTTREPCRSAADRPVFAGIFCRSPHIRADIVKGPVRPLTAGKGSSCRVIRFKVGQTVHLMPNRLERHVPAGAYTIQRALPDEGRDLQYRVKNVQDGHERVVSEAQLRPAEALTPHH